MRNRYVLLLISIFATYLTNNLLACDVPSTPYLYTITHEQASFNWYTNNTPGLGYQIQWRVVGQTAWQAKPLQTSTSGSLTGLTNNTSYELRVRSVCSAGDTSAPSAIAPFRTICLTPTNVRTDNITHRSARLSWSNYSSSTTTYDVHWRAVGTATWTVVSGIDAYSYGYTLADLPNNTYIEWRVRAICSPTAESDFSSTSQFQTQCSPPTSPELMRYAADAAQLRWQRTQLNLQTDFRWRALGVTTWNTADNLPDNEYTLTGLLPNTTYEWQVRSVCSATEKSAYTPSDQFTTQCTAPANLFLTSIKHNQITVSWQATSPAEVQIRPVNTTTWTTYPPTTSPLTLTGLTNNTTYEWRAKAQCLPNLDSYYTAGQTVTTSCAVPANLSAFYRNDNKLIFIWASGFSTVDLQWRLAGATSWTEVTGVTDAYTYLLADAVPNATYEWRIRQVCSSTAASEYTPISTVTTPCGGMPYLSSGEFTRSTAKLYLNWSSDMRGTAEVQWRVVGATNWTVIPGVTTTLYTLTGLSPATPYEWRVRRTCSATVSGNFSDTQTFQIPCLIVSNLYVNADEGTIANLSWYESVANTPYTVQYRVAGQPNWQQRDGIMTNGTSLTGLTVATNYEWRVRSFCTPVGEAGYSANQTFVTRCGAPISDLRVSDVNLESVRVTGFVSDYKPTEFELQYRDVGNAAWQSRTLSRDQLNGGYVLAGLLTNKPYEWRVRAICAPGVYGDFYAGTSFSTGCQIPVVYTGSSSHNSISLEWSPYSPGSRHELNWRPVGAANWQSETNLSGTRYTITGLTAGASYEYRIRQFCSTTSQSDFSSLTTAQVYCYDGLGLTLSQPAITSLSISWLAEAYQFISPLVNTYTVEYRVKGTPAWTSVTASLTGVFVNTPNQSSGYKQVRFTYTVPNLTPGLTYEARLGGACFNTNSLPASLYLTCPKPTNLLTAVSSTSASASWQANITGTHQFQWRAVDGGSWTTLSVPGIQGATSTVSLTGLTNNADYEWRVGADCGAPYSVTYSAAQPFRPACSVPGGVTLGEVGYDQATFSWGQLPDAVSVDFQYRLASSVSWTTLAGLSVNNLVISNLLPNTNYEYRSRSTCSGAVWSSTSYFSTVCQLPGSLGFTRTSPQSVNVSWTPAPGNPVLELKWRPAGTNTWSVVSATTPPLGLTGLSPNLLYEAKWQSVCSATDRSSGNTGAFSTQVTASGPVYVYVQQVGPGALLAKTELVDTKPYVLQWREDASPTWLSTGLLTAPTYRLQNLKPVGVYKLRIYVTEADGSLTYSNETTAYLNCPQAALTTRYTTGTEAGLTWTWNIQPASATTVLWRVAGAATWTSVPVNASATSYTLTGLTPNVLYEWRLQTTCETSASASLFFRTICLPPYSLLSGPVTRTTAQLSWQGLVPGGQYTIRYRLVGATTWTTVPGVMNTTYTAAGLLPNSVYEWAVATDCVTPLIFSPPTQFATQCALPVSLQAYGNGLFRDQTHLRWTGGGATYVLQWRPQSSDTWTTVPAVTDTHTLSGLMANTTYEWQLRTVCSQPDDPAVAGPPFRLSCATRYLDRSSSITIASTSAQFSVSSEGTIGLYTIRYRPLGSSTWLSATSSTKLASLTGLTTNTTYEYQLRNECQTGFGSSATFQTACTPPTGHLVDQQMSSSARLRWTDAGENVAYELQWRVAGTNAWTTVSNIPSTNYRLSGLTAGVGYEWQVRGQCAGGSGFQTTVSFTLTDDRIQSVAAGPWNSLATWSCSCIPTAEQAVLLRHLVTVPATFTGYAKQLYYEAAGKLRVSTGASIRHGQ